MINTIEELRITEELGKERGLTATEFLREVVDWAIEQKQNRSS